MLKEFDLFFERGLETSLSIVLRVTFNNLFFIDVFMFNAILIMVTGVSIGGYLSSL